MPLTIGGGINSIDIASMAFSAGADKLMIGTMLHTSPKVVERIASNYGSQAVVGALDCKLIDGKFITFHSSGRTRSSCLSSLIKIAHEHGVGELSITAIDNEGLMNGYSIGLLDQVISQTNLPVIINGGAGSDNDFSTAFKHGASGASASSIFLWEGYTNSEIKDAIRPYGIPVTN